MIVANNSGIGPVRRSKRWLWAVLLLLPVGCVLLALAVGRYNVAPPTVVKIIMAQVLPVEATWKGFDYSVVMQVRLPRGKFVFQVCFLDDELVGL
jgi:ABC-type Fe3+-siderophore transport system permease subunit